MATMAPPGGRVAILHSNGFSSAHYVPLMAHLAARGAQAVPLGPLRQGHRHRVGRPADRRPQPDPPAPIHAAVDRELLHHVDHGLHGRLIQTRTGRPLRASPWI